MPYVDLDTIAVINPGDPVPAAWFQQARDNQEFLIDPPACSVFNSVGQTLTDATTTVLTADSENFDNDGMHDLVTNNSRITIQTAGRFMFTSAVSFNPNSTGNRRTNFRVNGVTDLSGQPTITGTATQATGMVNTRPITLAAGDFVEVTAAQTSSGNLDAFLREFAATFITR